MLDRLIQTQAHAATRMGRIVQRISRIVAVPALLLMLGGLLLYGLSGADSGTRLPGPTSITPGDLLDFIAPADTESDSADPPGAGRVADIAMSFGLLGLTLVPGITVALIFAEHARARRWQDALVALVVVGILALSVLLGKG